MNYSLISLIIKDFLITFMTVVVDVMFVLCYREIVKWLSFLL